MGLSNIYNRIALISPYIEIALRRLYWHNVNILKRFNPNRVAKSNNTKGIKLLDFEIVINWLKAQGIRNGDLLIVHSGYGELESTGLSPDQIIDKLLDLIGPSGTLAMPVIRRYKAAEKGKRKGDDDDKVVYKYNVKKTVVTSGMLPYTLMQRKDAVISHHPFNPLCAVGPLAKAMMEHNLDGEAPSPHGPNSCWKFCYDHGAKVCSIGTDLEHHNTISHIAEEAFGKWYWPDEVWYDRINFELIDENKTSKYIVVSNRKEGWGKLHLAEMTSRRDQQKAGILISDKIEGITVGFLDPQKMMTFLVSKNSHGYPYYVYPWENVKDIH